MSEPWLLSVADARLDALSVLHGRCFDDAWSAPYLRSLLSTPGCFSVVAGALSSPDGFVVGRVATDEVEILTLAVRQERRRKGVGAALVNSAAVHAVTLGANAMYLEVGRSNVSARGLYAARGFLPVGERRGYYGTGAGLRDDAIILRAALPLEPLGKRTGLG
jgi:ribosomal-protein-alanine N-acetyltransferase